MKFSIFHPAGMFIQIFGDKSFKLMPQKLQKSAIFLKWHLAPPRGEWFLMALVY